MVGLMLNPSKCASKKVGFCYCYIILLNHNGEDKNILLHLITRMSYTKCKKVIRSFVSKILIGEIK
jgi:hypothetical protein